MHAPPRQEPTLWTIGHSTLELGRFLQVLATHRIERIADVRRFPGSRRLPQYGAEALAAALADVGIAYLPMTDLGGRRRPAADSPNTAWRTAGFRGYADYMQTREYALARERLEAAALEQRTALLCAEALWWQCHRGLLADDFKLRGWRVLHLRADAAPGEHPWTSAADVRDGRLSYAAPGQHALF